MSYTPTIKAGTDDFSDLLLEGGVFLDKSLMVRDFIQNSAKVLLITRPRRWGKSLNMNMLGRFLAIEVDDKGVQLPEEQRSNVKLFLGGEVVVEESTGKKKTLNPLKIAQQYPDLVDSHQGKFPVISLVLKGIKGKNYEEIEEGLKEQINILYIQHRYLKKYTKPHENVLEGVQKEKLKRYFEGNFGKTDLKDSLRFLTELLYKHFEKPVYVLISDDMQQDIQELVAGGSIVYPIVKKVSFGDITKARGLYSLLLFSGYLNPTAVDEKNYIYKLRLLQKYQ